MFAISFFPSAISAATHNADMAQGDATRRPQINAQRKTVSVGTISTSFDEDGSYAIGDSLTGISVKGHLPSAAVEIELGKGKDALGRYRELHARYGNNGRIAAIRLYISSSTVLLLDEHREVDANRAPFPEFEVGPSGLLRAGYKVYRFAPIQFGKLGSQGPWLFFNRQHDAMVLSPADNFLVSDLEANADGTMRSGIDSQVTALPANFSHGTFIVFGDGINHALDEWGRALQDFKGKKPISNDADIVLDKFGYWTDNGANYYYKYDQSLGYEGTLLAVRDRYRELGVPIAYMQLDSWWYPKEQGNTPGHDNGETVYRADSKIFSDGLQSFQQKLGLPLVTHARWIAPSSQYRSQYAMSKNVSIDPRFWNVTAEYLKAGGVVVYEQDWLDHNARPAVDITQSHQFLASMSEGMAKEGIGIQYCMALPAYFMASTEFQNLRTIRTSDDHFMRSRYDWFLYSSALAHALGLWPWSDVFMSSELPNLVVSTLSAGPVGTGDTLASIDATNLRRVMRSDSVILKPDTPLVPLDSMYLADAAAPLEGPDQPMIAATSTDFGAATERYVFSYPRVANQTETSIALKELGITSQVYAWDWGTGKGRLLEPGAELQMRYSDGWSYEVLAAVNKGGIALLGDISKIVPLARKRFAEVKGDRSVEAELVFAQGEISVTVSGYSQHRPHVRALTGVADNLHYDAATHLFSVDVSPKGRTSARVRIS